jgi:hypothetical protein
MVDIKPSLSTTFRLVKTGLNWQGTGFFRLKNVEFFSDQREYLGGVFRTLVGSSGDGHRAQVHITAKYFDFNHFHVLGAHTGMCTLEDKGPPWIQFELARGAAIVQGYRLQFVTNRVFGEWSVQASNDLNQWDVLDRKSGPPGQAVVEIRECQSTTAFRYFRIVYEVREEAGTPKLRVVHFDIFGTYLDVPCE